MEFQGILNKWICEENKEFARGGNSLVYKVRVNDGEVRALKLYRLELESERYKRFEQEIEVVKKLQGNTNVVSYLDHGFHNEKPFYVMQYFENGTLRGKYFHGEKINLLEMLLDFKKIVIAVESVHSLDLAIRDLKPQNILFDDFYNPILADFGLSLWVDMCDEERLTQLSETVGSQGYRPPEWQVQYPHPNHKPGDIWSLGRILWAIIAGKNPPNNYDTMGNSENHIGQFLDKKYANLVQSVITACTSQKIGERLTISELKEKISYVINEVESEDNKEETRKKDMLEIITRLAIDISNSPTYIDSKVLQSELNIKMSEVNAAAEKIAESLSKYLVFINQKIPADIGEFRVMNPIFGSTFMSEKVTIKVSSNSSQTKDVHLRYTPDEKLKTHKDIEYCDLTIYVGLTEEKGFYWIAQVRNQTKRHVTLIEQIEIKSLFIFIDNKTKSMDNLINIFLENVQSNFS